MKVKWLTARTLKFGKNSRFLQILRNSDASLIIRPDGTLLIRRGSSKHNKIVRDLVEGMVEPDKLTDFFKITENSEIIFGEVNLCG